MTKTDLVLDTVSNFHWPFTAADVARKLRWRKQDASSVLSYLVQRGDIVLQSRVSSDRSPVGYVNKYTLAAETPTKKIYLCDASIEEIVAELTSRTK
jgi:hypothetical protein